jgi:hypothetical protein
MENKWPVVATFIIEGSNTRQAIRNDGFFKTIFNHSYVLKT